MSEVGQLSYWSIGVQDLDKAQRFFGKVMGWTFSDPGSAGGRHVMESEPWGGLAPVERDLPLLAFEVPDIELAVATVRRLGGTAEDPPPADDHGVYLTCTDDQGTRFALFTRNPATR